MTTKTVTIQLRNSATAGVVPTVAQIIAAEPAINLADKKLFTSDGSSVFQVAPSVAEHNLKAPLASPALTGTPTAPTPAANTNTTQIATTAFVLGQAGSTAPVMNGTAAAGSATQFSRQDHVHPTDTSRAPLASPALTGTPTAPTAAAGANTTQIATTAFVSSAVSALVASAPATLNTLKELADALGDDANFSTTMTTALAGKEASFDTIAGGSF